MSDESKSEIDSGRESGSSPVTCSPLAEKLEGLRYCIAHGFDEDAEQHLFDLLGALRFRAAVQPGLPPERITPDGHASLRFLEENVERWRPATGSAAPQRG